MANSEACELYIQQEIAEGLAVGKKPGEIGKEVSAWVMKVFEVHIPPRSIEQKARRKSATFVATLIKTPEKPPDQIFTPPPPAEVVIPQTSWPEAVPPAPQPVKGGSKFNRTNESIEWAWWTWNPVTGCEHGCEYCYARGMAARYPANYPKGFKPHFRPERLSAPQNTPVPESDHIASRQVFTVSMGDLFGAWVPQEWIDEVFKAIRKAPQWNFILLTKNPGRYMDLDFPPNVWIGVTADTQVRADEALKVLTALREKFRMTKKKQPVLFLSVEPFREQINITSLAGITWLILGGQSQAGGSPLQPEWGWFESLFYRGREAGCKIYCKPNLLLDKIKPKEFPNRHG